MGLSVLGMVGSGVGVASGISDLDGVFGSDPALSRIKLKSSKGAQNEDFFDGEAALTGGACFVAGTVVQTSEGEEKYIEDIEAGDYVYACNTETGETGLKRVL